MKPLEEMGRFKTVVVDPPWPLKGIGFNKYPMQGRTVMPYPDLSYATMTLSDIEGLPIKRVLEDDAFLFLWAVNRFLSEAIQMVSQWGCKYSFTMTWVKNIGIQLPNTPRFNSEWCIVGRKGSPCFQDTKAFDVANYWAHHISSKKPEGFYDLLRRVTPAPRLDVFGRRRIAGFQSWGDEAPEGEALPDHYQQIMDMCSTEGL